MAPIGLPDVGHLAIIIEGEGGMLPAAMRGLARLLLDQSACLAQKIDGGLGKRVTTHDTARRLKTIPGIGAVTAAAITTFATPTKTFSEWREFAAWVDFPPRQHSSGGKDRLGRTSNMGQREIRMITVVVIIAGLMPILWAQGTRSEVKSRTDDRRQGVIDPADADRHPGNLRGNIFKSCRNEVSSINAFAVAHAV